MKIREFLRSATVLTLTVATLALTGCGYRPYRQLSNNYAGRTSPPSGLHQRVMVSVGNTGLAGTGGTLQILDALRDIRYNVYNVNSSFSISGYSSNNGTKIMNFPEQERGYIYSSSGSSNGEFTVVNYGTEATSGSAGTLGAAASDVAVSTDGAYAIAAQETLGVFTVIDRTSVTSGGAGAGTSYALSIPGAYRVGMNGSHTVMLAMIRNSNQLYRVVKLNASQTPPAGYISCLPQNLPSYCVVPVPGTYDHPYTAYFSPDGAKVYILNCGPECGGTTASVSVLNVSALLYDNYDVTTSPVAANISTPGGATVALSDGTTLYVAGQKYVDADGLFTGVLTSINATTNAVTGSYSISDGTHTKLLFADDNSLWIGSSNCASGERYKNQQNYNCLTYFNRSTSTAKVVPDVDPSSSTATVPYPNEDLDKYYYGNLTGICWVQGYNKIYTAYGGQIHSFNTGDGSERDNQYITVNGLALDVSYLDALTNNAN